MGSQTPRLRTAQPQLLPWSRVRVRGNWEAAAKAGEDGAPWVQMAIRAWQYLDNPEQVRMVKPS